MEENIEVLLDKDIDEVLKALGEIQRIDDGEAFCRECGIPITRRNLQIIVPGKEERIEYVCNEVKCVSKYLKQGGHTNA